MPEQPDSETVPAAAEPEIEEPGTAEPMPELETQIAEAEPTPAVADEVLLASVDLARRALLDVTPAQTVGSVVGHLVEDEHVLTLHFAADLAGYPGWHWSVTIARVGVDDEATVLETELMPGESALVAPDWVPWSERLADYQAAQEAIAAAVSEAEQAEGDDEDDDEELDELDSEDDDHDDGDADDQFDGIDIDALDESDESDDSDDSDDADDSEDSDDSDDADDSDDSDDVDESDDAGDARGA
ncbi:DUF3027 domain-containing protein [Agromyces albus]|uniref:DUF3027 domain-containing protein n=1 Tax=Agromyces albus TaxID=205332 RepID=UPI0027D8F8E1|nr:DUF3027 domain-containing protein [Agromyces albus]